MKKTIIGISILAIGIGTYFYLQDTKDLEKTKEVKKVENTIKEEVKKTNIVKVVESKKKKGPEIVKGYKLPPEPDPKINNSTLLGIDSNNNMLRDDVERWIVKQNWSDERIAASLQMARGFELILREDIGDNTRKLTLSTMNIEVHDSIKTKESGKQIINTVPDIRLFQQKVFNTKKRWEAHLKYDASFSGTIVESFAGSGKFSYKYADYKMEDGTLESYEFSNDRYYSNDNIPIYSHEDGLITSYWSLDKNDNIGLGGDWNDRFCEVNFGIPKNNWECTKAKRKYRKDFENGVIR